MRFKHYSESNSIIIAITCHGGISCIPEASPYGEIFIPEVVKIPEDIEIHKFNIAAPGVFSIASSSDTNYYLSVITHISSKLLNSTINKSQANEILSRFKLIYDDLIKLERENNDPDRRYLHYSHKGYNYNLLKGGDTIINKYFTRNLSEKQDNDFCIAEIINPVAPTPPNMLPKFPDLLEKVYGNMGLGSKDPFQVISVENMINYYRKMGITKIILFDFSCATFIKITKNATSVQSIENIGIQDIRKIRRNICREKTPYGGNNHKKKQRKQSRRKQNTKTKKRKGKR